MLDKFFAWMQQNSNLSDASLKKYKSGLRITSKEMLKLGVISKPLEEMTLTELDLALSLIHINPSFIQKNKRGNHMYSNALKQYRYYMNSETNNESRILEELRLIDNDISLSVTERSALTKARIGQGLFRKQLLEKYKGCCPVTGISLKQVLVASHIKPWASSNNQERLSVSNGILLSTTFDKLFDSGLISFKGTGEMLISPFITQENRDVLHLQPKSIYDIKPDMSMLQNLEYHRDVVFVKTK